jgi:SAM-dependent methyltransferase
MITSPLLSAERLYGRLLATAAVHALGGGPPPRARLRLADGRLEPLPLDRWIGSPDAADRAVLALAEAPVLDIGCGPGRHVGALAAAGVPALGVDLSPVAARLARERGAAVLPTSVWADVPATGSWGTALLLDGNIGIGGDPAALLRRTRDLLRPGGGALVELDPPGSPTTRLRVRLEAPGAVSEWFAWARVGADGLAPLALAAGLAPDGMLAIGRRWFAHLRRP